VANSRRTANLTPGSSSSRPLPIHGRLFLKSDFLRIARVRLAYAPFRPASTSTTFRAHRVAQFDDRLPPHRRGTPTSHAFHILCCPRYFLYSLDISLFVYPNQRAENPPYPGIHSRAVYTPRRKPPPRALILKKYSPPPCFFLFLPFRSHRT
jgi:hypothetical protein